MSRDSKKARAICFETHVKHDRQGAFLSCHVCGLRIDPVRDRKKWRADHIRRHAEGGKDTPENLWPICLGCDCGVDGKAAQDTSAVAKGKSMSAKHYGLSEKKKGNGFRGGRNFKGEIKWY